MDIRSFKLTDGTELIAELISETGLGYAVRRPLLVAPMRGQDGQPHIGFAMWSMIVDFDQEHELLDHALLRKPLPVEQPVAQSYIQQTSGIIMPAAATGQILKG